jgi:hypothetical protein
MFIFKFNNSDDVTHLMTSMYSPLQSLLNIIDLMLMICLNRFTIYIYIYILHYTLKIIKYLVQIVSSNLFLLPSANSISYRALKFMFCILFLFMFLSIYVSMCLFMSVCFCLFVYICLFTISPYCQSLIINYFMMSYL